VVGRHPHCDVRLPSIRVSRRHCCLTVIDGEVAVRDLGSLNGTWINDRRLEAGRLRPGETLTIAHLRYRLEEGQAAEASRADPPSASRAATIASLCDLPGTRLYDESGPATAHRAPLCKRISQNLAVKDRTR
jgi:predicted component of type VI protein secretion system